MDELLSVLKLSRDDLLDKYLNTEGITNHYCDFCKNDCIGNYHEIKLIHENICFKCGLNIDSSDFKLDEIIKKDLKYDLKYDLHVSKYYEGLVQSHDVCCNFCKKGNTKIFKKIIEYLDICVKCQSSLNITLDLCSIKEPPTYNDKLSYKYDIIFIKKINDQKYIYIVEENNFDINNEDIHYYLKYYDNGKIIIDHELQTYNPYAGIYDINIDIINDATIDETVDTDFSTKVNTEINTKVNTTDDIIVLSYGEKHDYCVVKLKPDNNGHNVYLKSKPNSFARCQNEKVKWHEIGEIIEFKVGNNIMKGKSYWYE